MIIDCEFYYAKQKGLDWIRRRCAEAGIDRAVLVCFCNAKHPQELEPLAGELRRDELFRGCVWLDPNQGDAALAALETAARDWGFKALKLMPMNQNFSCVSRVADPLLAKARELGLVVNIHTGGHQSHPLEIGELALRFPDVPLIMDHMGYRYDVPAAIAVARRSPNVYLMPTAVIEPGTIRQAVKAIGAERVVFGSNAPSVFPETQLLVVRQAELAPEDEAKVLGANAARLFGWEAAPVPALDETLATSPSAG
ncbi:MAG: amidohydrolase family protein [Kiritimatiellae bacterium]|nr:amidohydrolase family protein [Kiritimatiellia bacterium]